MRIIRIALLILPILLLGCPPQEPESPEKPKVVVKDDITMCPAACEHASSLGCYEAQPLVFKDTCEIDADCNLGVCIEGQCTETCVMVCEGLVNEGVTLGLECWQTITNCRQIESECR